MASGYSLPPPPPLEIHGTNTSEKWKKFYRAWSSYLVATELTKKSEAVQVATLLTVIGEEAREVFATFTWDAEGDDAKLGTVIDKFKSYCEPRKNVPFERYRFNLRAQEPGESYDQYRTALRMLADTCAFQSITPDEILRDRLVFGVRDDKVRERLLRESNLTLSKTDEICRAAESMVSQMKIVSEASDTTVHSVKTPLKGRPSRQLAQNQYKRSDTQKLQQRECWNCGQVHDVSNRETCPAYGKECRKCHKLNHFASKCRSRWPVVQRVKAVDTEECEEDEIFPMEVAPVQLDDTQLVTLKLESGNYIRFQADTGAQCNVIPLTVYKRATGDFNLSCVMPAQTTITAYGGQSIPVAGTTLLKVWRGDYHCKLNCKLIDSEGIRPLLGRKACVGMKIITYLDNDDMNKPDTTGAAVFAVEIMPYTSKEQLLKLHPMVFSQGVGKLEGHYHIRLSPDAVPTQHCPRRVPAALRERLQGTLEDLVKEHIITPVTEPTPWINSMVVVPKKNGTLRICLDPRDLNRYVQREHYQLPTIEDIATRLDKARVFTVLDVRSGFWHVELDEQSSLLTTFHTPFGRYRWLRMPFGISSAPEVFQRKMHELIEGLRGIEVVADDFVVIGFGDTTEDAAVDHDKNLSGLLQRCKERNVKLNPDKVQFKQDKVPFIGHVATKDGLCVDPQKVKAVLEMPVPTDVAGIQRLLGFAQYLSKFLPRLSDVTKPLRELTQKETIWVWEQPQQKALDTLKQMVTNAPVLRYYSLRDEVTIQCDASQTGLGAVLLQNGQPVAYASRALTAAETHYAQIEKELLAIVFACQHYDAFIYGRERVQVETDHKPLVLIMQKPLHQAPSRLQRMLLKLQRYNIKLTFKQGKLMYVADTLSRAYLQNTSCSNFVHSLENTDHTLSLSMPTERLQQVKHASRDDPVLQQLRHTILSGWPSNKGDVSDCLRPYFDFRDELVTQDELVFKGSLVIIPAALRKEMMASVHATHIGIEGCIRRARDCMFWPRMTTELREYISKCDVCLAHRPSQGKEPLMQHDITDRPWSKIGVDICELRGRTLLVVCDYYSNYIEVENLSKTNTAAVTKALKILYARYGVPDTVITDNGPQFASEEFSFFARAWGFLHTTSSPYYPQSNGKAENAVKTIKHMFVKCQESGQSEFQALLDWRNTPSEGIGTSPAQRFLGRRCRTLLPITTSQLQPAYSTDKDTQARRKQRQKQQTYYNLHVKEQKPIPSGQSVRIKLPGKSTWSVGICKGLVGPRSYEIQVGTACYRRNRRHLILTNEQMFENDELSIPEQQASADNERLNLSEDRLETDNAIPDIDNTASTQGTTGSDASLAPRRSSRVTRKPRWLQDYVPSS